MFAVVYEGDRPPDLDVDLGLHLGDNIRTGEKEFERQFGNLTTLERDLLVVASTILAADVAAKRKKCENVVRNMKIKIPVVNIHAFNGQKKLLHRILHRLSDDNWNLTFVRKLGDPEPMLDWPSNTGKTLLFSGGLDSLAAAVDLLDAHGADNIQLASHRTGNTTTISSQNQLFEYLQKQYGPIAHIKVKTGGKDSDDAAYPTEDLEVSQRTRSFMFLVIAAIAARRKGMNEIVMIAENGQMAIHLPLSGARIGAFSTHTAHPEFINKTGIFLSEVLNHKVTIENPYQYKTKAEVVAKLVLDHAVALPMSMSCWKGHRVGGHCGYCIPCFVRRIAIEFHGLKVDLWRRDVFQENVGSLPFTDEGKRNLTELASFAQDFIMMSDAELDIEHCDVNSSYFDRDKTVTMYRRFANEMSTVIGKYSNLNYLLN